MRIFFVGIHNKPNLQPLDSSSRSGRLIDEIIESLTPFRCLKTNLYDKTHLPHSSSGVGADEWADLNEYKPGSDVIVTLGGLVKKEFLIKGYKIIPIRHPASIWSTVRKREYVKSAVDAIKVALKNNS